MQPGGSGYAHLQKQSMVDGIGRVLLGELIDDRVDDADQGDEADTEGQSLEQSEEFPVSHVILPC